MPHQWIKPWWGSDKIPILTLSVERLPVCRYVHPGFLDDLFNGPVNCVST